MSSGESTVQNSDDDTLPEIDNSSKIFTFLIKINE